MGQTTEQLALQRKILQLLWDGLTIKQIAGRLERDVSTVHVRVRLMMMARGVETHVGLVRRALAEGLIRP